MTDIFQTNLNILRTKNPELQHILENHNPDGSFQTIPTPSGYPTLLRIPSEATSARYFHSPDDPVGEAEAIIKDFVFSQEDITVLLGFGLGYLPLAIINKLPAEHKLFIVDASPEILMKACQSIDLSPILSDSRVHLFLSDQENLLFNELEKHQINILGGEVQKLIYPHSYELFHTEYQDIEEKVEQFISCLKDRLTTVKSLEEITGQNIFENLAPITTSVPVNFLSGLAVDKPAVVVAAGPSLDRNIHRLKGVEDKLTIIAVDAALKPLLAEGITPHMVVSIDPAQANLNKFHQIPKHILAEIPLIYTPQVYHEIPPLFSKTRFVFGEPNHLSLWALSNLGQVDEYHYGFSVAHFAFYLARAMGADPIIFTGLDLALSMEKAHAKNCAFTWGIDRSITEYPTVKDIYGEQVPTLHQFIHMIRLFEKEIKQTEARCVDATEGGAYINGTEIMTLKKIVTFIGDETSAISPYLLRKIYSENLMDISEQMQSSLKWLLTQSGLVSTLSKDALSYLETFLTEFNKNYEITPEAQNIILEINKISDEVDQHGEFKDIVQDYLIDAMVTQHQSKAKNSHRNSNNDRLLTEIQKSEMFFQNINRASELISTFAKNALNRMEN